MKNSDYIIKILTEFEKYNDSLSFPTNDIRRDFHGMVSNSIRSFYAGHIATELAQKISDGKVLFTEDLIRHRSHFDNLVKIYKNSTNSINSLNRHVVISCWTSFEVSLTTLGEALLPEREKEYLNLNDYTKACKLLEPEIKDETLEKLKTAFQKKHLTHVQVWRKFSSLVKHAEALGKTYSRKRKDDIEFLSIYGDMRNCLMHSNGLYFGSNRLRKFNEYEIRFENGKQFGYRPEKEVPEFYIDLIINLSSIYIALTDLYADTYFISYPDTETI